MQGRKREVKNKKHREREREKERERWSIAKSCSPKKLPFHFSSILLWYINLLIGWGCRMRRQHLCRRVRPQPNQYLELDTKPSDDVAPVLELWEMWSALFLLLLPGPLRSVVVVPVRVTRIGRTGVFSKLLYLKIFNYVQTNA